jgi:AraC-like DNA-binding protein
MNDLLSVIELTGAIPGIFFALIFLSRKKGGICNKYLGLGLFFYSMILLALYLGRIDVFPYSGNLHIFSNTAITISWPLFYLYIGLVTFEIPSDRNKYIHAVPFIIYLVLFVIPAVMLKQQSIVLFIASSIFIFAVSIYYTVKITMFLQRFLKKSNNYFTEDDAAKVLWLKTTVVLWMVVIVLQTLFVPFRDIIVEQLPITGAFHAVLINLTSVAWIYAFAYFAISHPDLFERSKEVADALDDEKPQKEEKPPVSDDYDELIGKRLAKIIQEKKPYLNDQLTLPELADSINVPPYLLSRYVNKVFKKNFVTYINDLRLEAVKEKLKDPQMKNRSILEIAFQSGFRTKSAFNSYFKKSQGMTPTEFRRKEKSL